MPATKIVWVVLLPALYANGLPATKAPSKKILNPPPPGFEAVTVSVTGTCNAALQPPVTAATRLNEQVGTAQFGVVITTLAEQLGIATSCT